MDYHWKLVLVVSFFTAAAVVVDGHSIAKRNAFQLCNLVTQFTNRSCLSYNDYGCFCGLGQQAAQPTDSSDRCCKEHDDCYGAVNDGNYCYFWRGLFVGYEYTCQDNTCLCTDQTKCARKVCECDLKLAKCLGKATFSSEYMDYDRTRCVVNQ